MTETVIFGTAQPKQKEFFMAHKKYVLYGGGRGGGKSWAVREKAKRLAIKWPGIKILIIRRVYDDLRDNHILPLIASLPPALAKYREIDKSFTFINGSRIKCSYLDTERDTLKYKGQEYDVIFLEEATEFEESTFDVLKACLRGANDFPKRMYLTCNPDGVGFSWVKRLFIERDYRANENPEDYMFIQALVDDNRALMEKNPDYVRQLDELPDGLRERWRYGSWDVPEGQYFSEFRREIHVCEPFSIPSEWRRYRVFDYGLDMLACYFIAVDSTGDCYVYRELYEKDLPISVAAEKMISEGRSEKIYMTLAPPDMWGRERESGRTRADIFYESGLEIVRSNNDREAGWLAVKELLKVTERDGQKRARLKIFDHCTNLIRCLPQLLRDPKKPSDALKEPHEITHAPDALRYFAVWWIRAAEEGPENRIEYTKSWLEDLKNATSEEERLEIYRIHGGKPKNRY